MASAVEFSPEAFFASLPRVGTCGHRFEIHVPHISLDVHKQSFSYRSKSTWNGFPESIVMATTVASFKTGDHDL